jgi:hypothetical protein
MGKEGTGRSFPLFPLSPKGRGLAEWTLVHEAGRGSFEISEEPSPRRFAATLSRKRERGKKELPCRSAYAAFARFGANRV